MPRSLGHVAGAWIFGGVVPAYNEKNRAFIVKTRGKRREKIMVHNSEEQLRGDFNARMDGMILLFQQMLEELRTARGSLSLEEAHRRVDRVMDTLKDFMDKSRPPARS